MVRSIKKILVLSANPINTSKLRLDEEVREIQSALERSRHREEFELIPRLAVRIDDLRRALLDHEPEVVHFSGHGDGTDGITLEDNSGHAQLVSTESLSNLFKLFKDTVPNMISKGYLGAHPYCDAKPHKLALTFRNERKISLKPHFSVSSAFSAVRFP